jgi:hypothetical protein
MARVEEIQFIAAESGALLATVKGETARFLLENSDLIKTILEIDDQESSRVLVIPISGFPTDRRILFTNILNGIPIGKVLRNEIPQYYPLPPREEQNVQRSINAKIKSGNSKNHSEIQAEERLEVIFDTMRYLLIPDALIWEMLIFDSEDETPSSINNMINSNVNVHKKWLYSTDQMAKLDERNREYLKKYFNDIRRNYDERKENVEKQHKKQSRYRRYRENNNYNNSEEYLEYLDKLYTDYRNQTEPEAFLPVNQAKTVKMTPVEYEKYLRTEHYKQKTNKGLPQQNLHLNTLFNNTRRAEKGWANEQNNSKVIFYNPNKKTRKARRGAKRKSRRNNLRR